MAAPALLPWTGDEAADRLLAEDPNALLIGFALDQQVTVQKAFAGPAVLRERLGHLDPARIATMDADAFLAVCREKPAVHRFPGTMAARIQDLCHVIVGTYDGNGSRIWTEATSGDDLAARLGALPGIGPLKKKRLLTHFGSVKRILSATPAELLEVPSITQKDVTTIQMSARGTGIC